MGLTSWHHDTPLAFVPGLVQPKSTPVYRRALRASGSIQAVFPERHPVNSCHAIFSTSQPSTPWQWCSSGITRFNQPQSDPRQLPLNDSTTNIWTNLTSEWALAMREPWLGRHEIYRPQASSAHHNHRWMRAASLKNCKRPIQQKLYRRCASSLRLWWAPPCLAPVCQYLQVLLQASICELSCILISISASSASLVCWIWSWQQLAAICSLCHRRLHIQPESSAPGHSDKLQLHQYCSSQ